MLTFDYIVGLGEWVGGVKIGQRYAYVIFEWSIKQISQSKQPIKGLKVYVLLLLL